ncbi:MAG: zinc-ribbon domain-containing protein [Paracoccaceae bacterium]
MRLICPNCGAQYEVPDDVIPASGRDVQCSNCGDTWFQKHPSLDRDLAEDLEQPLDEAHWQDDGDAGPAPDTPELEDDWAEAAEEERAEDETEPKLAEDDDEDDWAEPEPAAEDVFEDEAPEDWRAEPAQPPEPEPPLESDWGDFADDDEEEDEDDEPAAPPPPPQRTLAPEVRDVLREEAEHEMRARAEDGAGLETQPDLGLDEAPLDEAGRREREARLRMARMRGLPDEEAAMGSEAALAAHASRRDLLPDIDEINSTLRKDSERVAAEGADAPAAPAEAKGFSRGFRSIVLLAVLAIVVYVFATQIGDLVPQAKAPLAAYVAWVDAGRVWLDRQVLALTQYLDGLISG